MLEGIYKLSIMWMGVSMKEKLLMELEMALEKSLLKTNLIMKGIGEKIECMGIVNYSIIMEN